MKKVSFEQLGLVNLSAEETQEINGGGEFRARGSKKLA
jgi:hypothetical protein